MNKKAIVASIAALAITLPVAATLPAMAAPDMFPQPVPIETTIETKLRLRVDMTPPSNPTEPVVLRIRGLQAGHEISVVSVLARKLNEGPYAAGTNTVADAKGRATVTLRPFDGAWTTDESYLVFVVAADGWTGTFALPGDVDATEAPVPTKSPRPTKSIKPTKSTKPSKAPTKAPIVKDRTRGLANTGV